MIDINDHLLWNKLYTKLKENNSKMEEFTHKCWGPKEPYTHNAGKSPINNGYIMPEVEIVSLSMLHFAKSPEDHRSFLFDVSVKSLLGVYKYKVCRPVRCRLVMSQEALVKRYNEIVLKQFKIHRIEERLDAVDKMTRYCRYPCHHG